MLNKFDNYRKIGIFNKKGSPYQIMLCSKDNPDLWLIDRIKYKIKSGQIVEDVFILNKEIRDERIFWEKKGFTGMIRTKFKIQGKTISFE